MGGRPGRGRFVETLVACAFACLLFASSAAAAGYTKQTFSVPVTQSDVFGRPVSIDTDVYLPDSAAPRDGRPLLVIFHGGGSNKDNPYDSGHAAFFAQHGYAVILYSQRGNQSSGGQEHVAGPPEMHDVFDVTAWALKRPEFQLDRARISLAGYSQGGLNTNLAQVYASDPAINPYGISFRALEPGNTPDVVFNALVPNQVVKLSFGVGLLGTYAIGAQGRVAPEVAKWIAVAAADQPAAYGGGDVCDATGHDRPASTMKQDLAARSVGCFAGRMTRPVMWAQAFDDALFPPDMAISMWQRMPNRRANRLYLDMGGHAAPAPPAAVEEDKLALQLAFLGRAPAGPPVVYWTRDPAVTVPADSFKYPDGSWYRQTAASWPPAGVSSVTYQLSADGRAVRSGGQAAALPLQPLAEDEAHDPVTAAALSGTPLGTSPVPSALPATNAPGYVAAFDTGTFPGAREMTGAPLARLAWTPTAAES